MSPIYVPGKVVLRKTWQPMDADAAAYITAVETADGQALEEKTKIAIDNFVLGCKADGIWSAIKASCILSGARTLSGALVPLVGTAPTNFNFVTADYNRKTGLVGNGSTKYLDSNRNNNADPQNSNHNAVFVSTAHTGAAGQYLGTGSTDPGRNNLLYDPSAPSALARSRTAFSTNVAGTAIGFYGHARSSSPSFILRVNGTNLPTNLTSDTPENATVDVFRRGTANYANARLAFYSIGESLDLSKLDARVTDLINAFGAAIP
jgi:hypothetical protein